MTSLDRKVRALLLIGTAALAGCGGEPEEPRRSPAPEKPPIRKPAPTPRKSAPAARIRAPVFAGSWYPADAATLSQKLAGQIRAARLPTLPGRVRAVIAPHAGLHYSGPVAAHAFKALKNHNIRRVFLLCPSHRVSFHGIALPTWDAFATPLGDLRVDSGAVARLAREPFFVFLDKAYRQEHSLEMELIFLAQILPAAVIVPGIVGSLDPAEVRRAGATLRKEVGAEDVLVISSDFTHYGVRFGYLGHPPFQTRVRENLNRLDGWALATIAGGDPDAFLGFQRRTGATICGRLPIAILLATLAGQCDAHRLCYDTSGNLTGNWSSSVSYMAIAFTTKRTKEKTVETSAGPLNEAEKQLARKIAWRALVAWVKENEIFDPVQAGLVPEGNLNRVLGCFVTLKKKGQLRGCIGTIMARHLLWQDLVDRARDAAANDTRFERVRPDELDELTLQISVLTPVRDVSGPEEIVVGRHGILLAKGSRRAVFLPQVATEQGWDLETTLAHLARKAGLPPEGWREGCTFQVFEAQVF